MSLKGATTLSPLANDELIVGNNKYMASDVENFCEKKIK